MKFLSNSFLAWTLACLVGCCGGCLVDQILTHSQADNDSITTILSSTYDDELYRFLDLEDGYWAARWKLCGRANQARGGRAQLELRHREVRWHLQTGSGPGLPAASDSGALHLVPVDSLVWHTLSCPWPLPPGTVVWPLPRLPCQSPYYADLLHFLQEILTPRFGAVVPHWPTRPVPVRCGEESSGDLNLTACLREAVAIWNEDAPDSVFHWLPTAAWGVRLVHLPIPDLQPPLATKLIRWDDQGFLQRVHILIGEDYCRADQRPYLVRGLVHELAHALLLWGHSEDRQHVLWRCGPLVSHPASDEKRAARLLALLPVGLDLARYGRSMDVDPPGHQSQ